MLAALRHTHDMTEDETYRASTQYRLWSFTPPALASLRSTTNALASEGVKAAIQSKRAEAEGQNNGELTELAEKAPVVECLTVEEEQRLVGFYCLKTMEFASFCEFPTNVMVKHSPTPAYCITNRSTRQQQCSISSVSTSPTHP